MLSNDEGSDATNVVAVTDCISRAGKQDTYEIIPDTPFKYNFDFDLKPNITSADDFDPQSFNHSIVPILQKLLCEALACKYEIEPIIKMATSNGLTADKEYKYSARFYCQNILANRDTQKAFVTELNARLKNPKSVFITGNSLSLDFTARINGVTDDMIKFDTQVYSPKRKMRCVGTSKPGEMRPLELYDDATLEDTILSASFHPNSHIDTSTPPKQIITNTTNVNVVADNKYIELMHLIGNKINRAHWLKLTGWAINHISKQEYMDFIDPSYHMTAEEMWNSLSINKRDVSIFTIENIAKIECPEKYKEWCKKHKKMITVDILNKGEQDVCEFVSEKLKEYLVFCNKEWYSFNDKTGIWDIGINPTFIIIKSIQNEISYRLAFVHNQIPSLAGEERAKLEKEVETLNNHYRKATSGSYSTQCKKCLEYLLCDNSFYKKLNVLPYKIPFKNGRYHLDTKAFTKIEIDDYVSVTLKRNYSPSTSDVKAELRAELFKICNCNEKHLEYYLSILGYAFCGVAFEEQLFWSLYGATAANGKSTIFTALNDICPELVAAVGNEFFEENEKMRHKTLDTLSSITRIIYADEMKKKKQDNDFIKQIANGTTISYGKMHGNKKDLPVNFKVFMISNNILDFDNDNGIQRRIRTCEFSSSFRDIPQDIPETRCFKANKDFHKDLRDKYSNALLDIIFEYAFQYCKDKSLKPYPDEWKDENDNVIACNNVYDEIFENEFEFNSNYRIHKDDVACILQKYGIAYKQKELLGDLRRYPQYNISYNSQMQVKMNGKNIKGWWVGMRQKIDNVPSPEEEILVEE